MDSEAMSIINFPYQKAVTIPSTIWNYCVRIVILKNIPGTRVYVSIEIASSGHWLCPE
jgi:hypothetical protein